MRALALALTLLLLAASGPAPRSGYEDASPQTRAMQDDDSINPAFLWVQQGESLWNQPPPSGQKSCTACHGDARRSMRGVAARSPAYDAALGRPVTLPQRINLCRATHQGLPALASESDEMLALSAYVGLQSRGMPVAVSPDGPMRPFYEDGQRLYTTRQGQLNLACSQCHDDRAGMRLGGALIPQGHANGYPIYRLEWQTMGSFNRRLGNCLGGVRAETWGPDSPEATAIEVYLAVRATGLRSEVPAVRP